MPAPVHTPSWLSEVYDQVEKVVHVASGIRRSMAESKLHVEDDPVARLDFKAAALALAHARRDANNVLQEAEIPLRANAAGVWEACRAALEAIEPINHACMHVLAAFGMNAGDHLGGVVQSCPAFENCHGFTGNIPAYFAAVPSVDEGAILERMRVATIAVAASRRGAGPMSGRPRSQAPRSQAQTFHSLPTLNLMIRCERDLVETGAARHLATQMDSDEDRFALILLQRACERNEREVDKLLALLAANNRSWQWKVNQAMSRIADAACQRALLAVVSAEPARGAEVLALDREAAPSTQAQTPASSEVSPGKREEPAPVVAASPWSGEGEGNAADAASTPESESSKQPVTSSAEPAGMTWQDAAERMERLRTQGQPFTSQQKLADDFGCSSGTINKAIRRTPSLQAWANPRKGAAAATAQSLNDFVTDSKAQDREPDPKDEAAVREYLERDLTPDERAFFNSLSREDQLDFLDDPDKHPTIRWRKP